MATIRILAATAIATTALLAAPAQACLFEATIAPTDRDVPHVGEVHLDGHYVCVE